MTDKYLSTISDMTQSLSIDPSALLTTSTINALHFPDLTTSGISDTGVNGRTTSFNLDGIGMCESMTESFCSVAGQDESMLLNNTHGLHNEATTPTTPSLKNIGKKESINSQRKRRSRKAQYDASVDGILLEKIETVNIHDDQNEADDTWLFPVTGNKTNSTSENIFSWVHKEFKENDINAVKHRLLCKLDDMSHARTIRSISCHNFPSNQRSDSVKRSSTEQQVNPGILLFDENKYFLHSTDLIENALYLTEIFTSSSASTKKIQSSTLSLDSIEKDHDQFDLFLYDSLNDESDVDDHEQFYDCSNDTILYQTITHERKFIERLTHRCASLDSLDNDDRKNLSIMAELYLQYVRIETPSFNGNSNTRPTSPATSSSPLRNTVNLGGSLRSREASRERQPLDYTDLEVMAKVQLENLRQSERQGPLSKRHGGSSNNLLDSRDNSPSSVFGATRNTSPVNNGYMTPRRSYSPSPAAAIGGRIPIRKNSFVVTESQYTHVLPSVSPRSGSPAIRTGQRSGRVTPSALETCMETSFIATNNNPFENYLLPNMSDDPFADSSPGGSNVSLTSICSTTSINISNQAGTKPPVIPKSTLAKNGVKPNNHRRSNTQTISTNVNNSYDLPDASDTKPPTPRTNAGPTNTNKTRPPVSRPLQSYRGSQTSYNNSNPTTPTATTTPKVQSTVPKITKKQPTVDLNSTFTAKQFPSNENNLLNDVSNKPLTTQVRSQVTPPRRTPMEQIPPSASVDTPTPTTNGQSSIPRSSSSLSQSRKSGIPTIGKQQRPSIPTATRPTASSSNTIPSSQSSDNMMVTRNIRPQGAITRPQIPDTVSPTSSWNEGCY